MQVFLYKKYGITSCIITCLMAWQVNARKGMKSEGMAMNGMERHDMERKGMKRHVIEWKENHGMYHPIVIIMQIFDVMERHSNLDCNDCFSLKREPCR
jgi:hypothetical protein